MALVIVLGALVLLSLLAVAFLVSVNKELSASKTYASGVSARGYADAVANVVVGQLRASTTQDDPTQVWVSQPGLIRVFNNQGNQVKVFKLYSSDKLVEGATFAPLAPDGTPADVVKWSPGDAITNLPWNKSPGLYTDLNSPIVVNQVAAYPIINPGGLNAATRIQGFDVSSQYTLPDSRDWNGNGNTTEVAQIPMPVRWLYILADGRMATAQEDPSSPKSVVLAATDGAPITKYSRAVARVAFWTDDDSCRLNVNTASEGSFWMVPVAAAADLGMDYGQVNPREYQRYPGHPATTSLSPVFSSLTTTDSDLRNFIFSLTPRISGRGSQFGSRYIGWTYPVANDNDRLFASIDDILFLPKLDGSGNRYEMSSANIEATKASELDWQYTSGGQTLAGTPYHFSSAFLLDARRLELLRFFLTTNSRAPEVNLMGKPRISLWPVDTRADHISIYDKLLAFCSTVNGTKYYFQRQNPNNQNDDIEGIPRNQDLLGYLDRLTSTAIPGIGGSLGNKYSTTDRKQQEVEIFDWIRTVNLAYRDKTGAVLPYAWTKNNAASSTTGTVIPPGEPGSGQVLPIKWAGVQGVGRFPVVSKGALAIIREGEAPDQATGTTTLSYRVCFVMETYVPMMGYAGYVPKYQISVSGLGGFSTTVNVNGTINMNSPINVSGTVVSGTSSPQAIPLSMQDGTILVTAPSNVEPYYGRAWGGTQGYNNLFLYSDSSAAYALTGRTIGSADPERGYPFVSEPFTITVPTADKDKVRLGLTPTQTVTIKVMPPDSTTAITTDVMTFNAFDPVLGAVLADPNSSAGSSPTETMNPNLQTRVNEMVSAFKISSGGMQTWLTTKGAIGMYDIVRGVELQHGDLRLLAMQGSNVNNPFVPHRDYSDTSYPQAHSLLRAGGALQSATDPRRGKLINSGTASYKDVRRGYLVSQTATLFTDNGQTKNYWPQAPSSGGFSGIAGQVPSPGDFTTGMESEGDGPHIIKADEGNSSFSGLNWGMSRQIPYENQLFPYNDRLSDTFSPNRQVTSAVQFGTLPSTTSTPWRTFLFRPNLDPSSTHPGSTSPGDSALLDLFWMPIVDPYPISEPLSTAGKVNMNYQIAPFTYITRSTAMLGALKSIKIPALPKEWAENYKNSSYTPDPTKTGRPAVSFFYGLDGPQTLRFFDEKFSGASANNNIFKSATEICSVPLAPMNNTNSPIATGHSTSAPTDGVLGSADIAGATSAATLRSQIASFWRQNTLTGDNALEAPYNSLYPRLTTQSNTYTTYVRVQTLQASTTDDPSHFSDNHDRVTGEYRGSYTIERYIDYNNSAIPDFATAADNKTLYPYYQFRIEAAKQFLP